MPDQLTRIKTILKLSRLEDQETFQHIISHPSFSYLGRAIESLYEDGLLNRKSLNLLIENKNPILISDSIQILDKAKLYNEESLKSVLDYKQPLELLACIEILGQAAAATRFNLKILLNFKGNLLLAAESMVILSNGGILSQAETAFVLNHRAPVEAASALVNLKTEKLMNEKFKEAIVNDKVAITAIRSINRFAERKILTEARLDSALQCKYPAQVANIVADIDEVGALSKENETAIFNHRGIDALQLESIIKSLKNKQLLTPEITKKILECRYLPLSEQTIETVSAYAQQHVLNFLGTNISQLHDAEILNENNIHQLIETVNRCSDNDQANTVFNRYFSAIPLYQLSQEVFDGFITSCVEGGQDTTNEYLRNLGIDFDDGDAFNGQQSTHTESVEESVSVIALELKKRYGDQLTKEGVDAVVNRIENHLLLAILENNTEFESYKIEAALTYIKDIRSQIGNPFYDSRSNMSLPEVVALARLAIEDEKERIGSFDDAFKSSAQGYYEAQREYNLDINGQEKVNGFGNRMSDVPACRGGQFNKSLNSLQGNYKAADIAYATTQTATNKLQALIKQKVWDCLEHKLADTSPQGLSAQANDLLVVKELEEKLDETRQTTFQALWSEFSNFSGVFGGSTELVDKLNTCQVMVDAGYDVVDLPAITQEYIKKIMEKKDEFSDLLSAREKATPVIPDLESGTRQNQATGITLVGLFRQFTSSSLTEAERIAREEAKEFEKNFTLGELQQRR